MSAAADSPSSTFAASESCFALECDVAAFGTASLNEEQLRDIRKSPMIQTSIPLAPSVARHCDEQTIASLFAVGEAMRRMNSKTSDFSDWGIVASTRYLGRAFFSQALDKFDREGPWNTSVQVVPHRSLHSPSSTISLALGCHGPNVGVGGAIDGEGQGLLAAASMLDEFSLPGVWLIFAGWSPELSVDALGQPIQKAHCDSLAMALKPIDSASHGLRLRLVPDFDDSPEQPLSTGNVLMSSWLSTLTTLLHKGSRNLNVIASLADGIRVEITWNAVEASVAEDSRTDFRAAG
ncbi:MAG: hypothetical protein NTW75_09485 [Planctomycetales bacterium]|nr:hypothetical protein [Planctomycetales bacterium]